MALGAGNGIVKTTRNIGFSPRPDLRKAVRVESIETACDVPKAATQPPPARHAAPTARQAGRQAGRQAAPGLFQTYSVLVPP